VQVNRYGDGDAKTRRADKIVGEWRLLNKFRLTNTKSGEPAVRVGCRPLSECSVPGVGKGALVTPALSCLTKKPS
jgi:hypothetical protein